MLYHDFEASVGFWLITAAHAYQKALNEQLAPEGITYRQCQVLGYLALEGPLAQTDLADRIQIEPPTLVGILDRMERDGWIERKGCPEDRRRKLVHPTPASLPIWSKILACAQRVRSQATQGMSERQISTLKRLLGIVQKNLSDARVVAEETAK